MNSLAISSIIVALLGFNDPVTQSSSRDQIIRCPVEPHLIGIRLAKRGAGIDVVEISPEGAFFRLGLRAGDVITRIDNERANQPIHILRMFALKDGDTVAATRLGKPLQFVFSKSLVTGGNGLPVEGCLTLGLMPFSEDEISGLWIRILNPFGPFSRTGLRFGDLIVSVNGKRVHSETDKEQVFGLKVGDEVGVIRANDLGSFDLQVPTQENPTLQIIRPDHLAHFTRSLRDGNSKKLTVNISAQ